MPIEIIPKPVTKKDVGTNYFLIFCATLLLIAVIVFFVLSILIKDSKKDLEDLELSLAEGQSSERKALEKEVSEYKKKIGDYSEIINTHKFNSSIFKFLEPLTHPKVFFSTVTVNATESKITLRGQTDSFQSLGQQLLIFEDEKNIQNLLLNSVSLGKEGGVDFAIDFSVDPQILLSWNFETESTIE